MDNKPHSDDKKVTFIEYDEKRPGLAHIHINGKKAFSMPAFDAGLLECGQEIPADEIAKRSLEDEKQRCWATALRLLAVRSQSRAELKKKLMAKAFGKVAVEMALSRAQGAGYIDDEAFARQWIESRMRSKPKGRYLLKQELKGKGVDEPIIEKLLSEELFDETQMARLLIEKRAWKWKKLDDFRFKQKACAYLAGKGFTYDIASEAVEAFLSLVETDE